MVDFNYVIKYIEEIKNISDIDILADHFTKTIRGLGFHKHITSSVVDLAAPPANSILISKYPQEWLDRYIDENYCDFDEVVKSAFNQSTPYIWRDLKRDKKNQQIFSESSEFGIVRGITIPIFVEGFYPSTVNIAGDDMDIPEENFHALHLISIHYHDLILKIKTHSKDETHKIIKLTKRQKECLQWAAVGKSYNDIGDILSISSRTVQFHISNTMKKFGVVTHEQAIAKATSMGIVLP